MVAGFVEVIEIEETLVATVCNHPDCLVLPFRLELIRLAAYPHAVFLRFLGFPVADSPGVSPSMSTGRLPGGRAGSLNTGTGITILV